VVEQKTKARRLNVPVTPDAYADIELAVMHFRSQSASSKGKPTPEEFGAVVATIAHEWRQNKLK
jgi:hypothetical protein